MKKYTFINPDVTFQDNLMAFGYECGEGWLPIIEELFDRIQKMVDHDPDYYKDFEVVQVKEKFGVLCIYTSVSFPEIDVLIDVCCKKSEHICEVCGEEGSLKTEKGWTSCLCHLCRSKKNTY